MKRFVRIVVGWHLAYLAVWALTTPGGFSWTGPMQVARWVFCDALRAVAISPAAGVVNAAIIAVLLLAGLMLMFGFKVKIAAVLGIAYLAMMYIIYPPHLGDTGVSHLMYVDYNVIEALMLVWVACASPEAEVEKKGASK